MLAALQLAMPQALLGCWGFRVCRVNLGFVWAFGFRVLGFLGLGGFCMRSLSVRFEVRGGLRDS